MGTARTGFNMDMKVAGFRQTIVKDGILLNQDFWDKDLNNDVFVVNPDDDHTHFYFYMTKQENAVYKDSLVDKIWVDADQEVMNPVIEGSFANAGIISLDPKEIKITYNCLERKKDLTTIVELSVEMMLYESI